MKLLFLFTDMLRPNLLKTYNSSIYKKGPIDNTIEKIGETIFSNCYTPAPDMPRSLACFNSGCYPDSNGCTTRIKWPYYYYTSNYNIFSSFIESNYRVHYYATEHKINNGPIPKNIKNKICIYNNLKDIEKIIEIESEKDINSVYFLTLDDYHWTNDDYGHNSLGDYFGQKKISNYLNSFLSKFSKDMFNYIFWFSDHGHKLSSEFKKEHEIDLINDDRTKIHLLMRLEGDESIKHDNNLRSILDIYPSVLDIIKKRIPGDIDGKSLFSQGHDTLYFEDHSKLNVTLNQVIDLWGVRTNQHLFMESVDSSKLYEIDGNHYREIFDNDLCKNFKKLLENYSSKYVDIRKQLLVLSHYKNMKNENSVHSDNSKRLIHNRNIFIRIIKGIFKNYYKRW